MVAPREIANNSDPFITPITNLIVNPGANVTIPGQYRGIIIQSILSGGIIQPTTYGLGFNFKPPATVFIRDSFSASGLFGSCQIYNPTTDGWTVQGLLYRGRYIPGSSSGGSSGGDGIFSPAANSIGNLRTIQTTSYPSGPVGEVILYVDSTSLALVGYQLRPDNTGVDNLPGKVVPADWNAVSNPNSWYQVLG